MAYLKLSSLWNLRLISLVICLFFATNVLAEDGGHGGGEHGGAAKPKSKKEKKAAASGLSPEDMEKMRVSQDLEFLTGDNYQFFESATFNFEKMGERAVQTLLNFIKKKNHDDRAIAATLYALGRLGKNGNRAVQSIIPYLTSENRDVKMAALSALGRIGRGSESAVPIIRDYLGDHDEWLNTTSQRVLKEIGTPEALQILKSYKNKLLLEEKRKNLENGIQPEVEAQSPEALASPAAEEKSPESTTPNEPTTTTPPQTSEQGIVRQR